MSHDNGPTFKQLKKQLKGNPSQVKQDLLASFQASSYSEPPKDQLLDPETNQLLTAIVQQVFDDDPELTELIEETLSFEKQAKNTPPRC